MFGADDPLLSQPPDELSKNPGKDLTTVRKIDRLEYLSTEKTNSAA